MKLTLAGAALLTAALCFIPSAAPAHAPKRVDISEDVARAMKSGSARVIVGLDSPAWRGGAPALLTAHAHAVAHAQAGVLAALPDGRYRLRALYSHLPALSLEIGPEAFEELQQHPQVRSISLDYERFLSAAESHALTRAHELIAAGFGGAGIHVAVIDSGVSRTHLNLADDLLDERCFRVENDCPNGTSGFGSAVDQNGHGTHVAGTITGAAGVAPDAKVIALKVFTTGNTTDTNILNALNSIIANHTTWQTRVVNMSLSGGLYATQAACNADNASYVSTFASLNNMGIAVFAATGNGASASGVGAPACVSGAIGVGSVSHDVFSAAFGVCTESGRPDKVSCFSNTTATRGSGALVDILAPGCRITAERIGSPTATSTICGTSMASPTAAGIAASLLSFAPGLTPPALEQLLEDTADPVTDHRNGVQYPRVNAMSAFSALAVTMDTPQNLIAAAVNPARIDLQWDDVDGEDGYEVQRSRHGTLWTTVGTPAADATTFSDTAPACDGNLFRVRAVNSSTGEFSAHTPAVSATSRTCPLAPSELTAVALDSATVQLAWTDNASTETAYEVHRSNAGAGNWDVIATLSADSSEYTDLLGECMSLRYRVRAFAAADDDHSEYSNEVSVAPCAPPNDLFEDATLVTSALVEDITSIRWATTSEDDPQPSCRFGGAATGSNSVWYRLTSSTGGAVTISTAGSSLIPPGGGSADNDTIMAIYAGEQGALTELACNDDISSSNFLSRISEFVLTAGTTYHVYIARWSLVPMTWDGTLRVEFTYVLLPPQPLIQRLNNAVELSWPPIGDATSYRIERKSGLSSSWSEVALLDSSITSWIDDIDPCAVYDYRMRSSAGADNSVYSVVVRGEPANCSIIPPHDHFGNARIIGASPYSDVTTGIAYATRDTADPLFQPSPGCPSHLFPSPGAHTVWYVFTPPRNGLLTADTIGSAQDTVLGVYTGSYGALAQVACDDDSGGSQTSLVSNLAVSAGVPHYLHIARWNPTPTMNEALAYTFNLSFSGVPHPFLLQSPTDGTSVRLPDVPEHFVWQAADDAASYTLQISNADGVLLEVAGLAASDYSLSEVQKQQLVADDYLWTVIAHNAIGDTPGANGPFTFEVLPESTPPSSFTLVAPDADASFRLPATPEFAWTSAIDAVTYTLRIGDGSSDIVVASELTGTSHTLSPSEQALLAAGDFTWSVVAENATGTTPASNGPRGFTLLPALEPPGAFALTAPADGATYLEPLLPAEFAWTAAPGAAEYRLTVSDGTADVIVVEGITGTEWSPSTAHSELLGRGDYSWRVTAMNADGSTDAGNGPHVFRIRSVTVFAHGFESP